MTIWETPPPPSPTRLLSKYDAIYCDLIENPGQWALLWIKPNHCAVPRQFRGPRFERKYRTEFVDGQKVNKAYARYVG